MVNKLVFFVLLAFTSSFGFSQSQTQGKNPAIGCWNGLDIVLNHYSDSLNLLQQSQLLPDFLKDYLMDWRLRDHLSNCLPVNERLSYRKSIIDRVSNVEVLKRIISARDKEYDKCYSPDELRVELKNNSYLDFPELPFMKDSFRILATNRLAEIEQRLKNK